jgi:hypothetical protein
MMWEYLTLLPLIFPVGFIFYKRGGNKFLFISSVVGIAILTEVILLMISLPINLFLIFIVPSIAEIGYAEYLHRLSTRQKLFYWKIFIYDF